MIGKKLIVFMCPECGNVSYTHTRNHTFKCRNTACKKTIKLFEDTTPDFPKVIVLGRCNRHYQATGIVQYYKENRAK